jgi:KTSC domain
VRREPVSSAALSSVGWDDGTLEIEFTSGEVYRYRDVPALVFRQLLRAESKGTFFQERIRDRYDVELPEG